MDNDETRPDKTRIAMGLLFLVVGVVPLLAVMGILPAGHEPADPAPSWLGWVIGLMFVGAGFYIILSGFTGDNPSDATATGRLLLGYRDLLAFGIIVGLGALFSWIAFGPGPRHFSVAFMGFLLPMSGDIIGRAAFGLGALLAWGMLIHFAVTKLRRPR